MIEIEIRSASRRQMIDISGRVREAVRDAGVVDGLCTLWVPHTTAALVVNEHADPDVARDLLASYETLVPKIAFAHAEGNSDAHLLASLLGPSETLPVVAGQLRLGTWQGVFFVELDGPRTRRVWITVR